MTDFGVVGMIGGYGVGNTYLQKRTVAISGDTSFLDAVSAKTAEKVNNQANVGGMSFKDMWQARFPGAYYHVLDASHIPQNVWERYDFPHEKFFSSEVDESILNWQPAGAAPKLSDASVQSRLNSVLGKNAVVVPPALEEKLKTDPALAEKVMANIDHLFAWNGFPSAPDGAHSALIVLDENGEVARWQLVGSGFMGPSEEELRQIEARQKAREERREEYARLNEESALKRRLMEQEADERYYKDSMTKKAVSVAAYEAAGILK